MFVKIPQENGARYVDLDYITSIQTDGSDAIFFFEDNEVLHVSFKDAETVENVIEGMFYYSGNFYEIDEDDIAEVD